MVQMTIFSHLHTYGRSAKQGADKMMQSLLQYLALRGCAVTVGVDENIEPYNLNGVVVISSRHLLGEHYEQADAILLNIEHNHPGLTIAKRFNKPVFQVAHNAENRTHQPYIIYNSQHLADSMNMDFESIVVNPPTYLKDWQNDIDHFEQKYITLVNCCPNKGSEMLLSLATWMPQYKFLGIYGGYGHQMSRALTNVTYRPFALPISYDDTRIVIVPSKKESWSLSAAEAMASGIPVICADLPGLRENCGEAAIYCSSLREYMDAILLLNDERAYRIKAGMGIKRIAERNHGQQLENLYNFIASKVMPQSETSKWALQQSEELSEFIEAKIEKEKIEIPAEKEKREIKPKREKKIIRRR